MPPPSEAPSALGPRRRGAGRAARRGQPGRHRTEPRQVEGARSARDNYRTSNLGTLTVSGGKGMLANDPEGSCNS